MLVCKDSLISLTDRSFGKCRQGYMCALLSLSYTDCSEVDEEPSQTCDLGNTSEKLSLELAWILAGSIWKMTHADDA